MPTLEEQIKILQEQIDELKEMFKKLESSTTIPFNVGQAMKERVKELLDTTKTVASETETLGADPTGVTVPKLMNGFFVTEDGKYIPFYTD